MTSAWGAGVNEPFRSSAVALPQFGPGGAPASMKVAASAAKLQLVQSPTFRSNPLTEGAFSRGASSGGFLGGLGGKKSSLGQSRVKSMSALEVHEVRQLADDTPVKDGDLQLKGPHEQLMQRLKSRAARKEADSTKNFLAAYRNETIPSPSGEAKLDELLKSAARRSEELRERSQELEMEVAEAERKLEKANTANNGRASDSEMQTLNAFERSQRRIQEDKHEEDLQKQREDVQANYAKVHRRMQNELIELRDYKVLLREYRRVRLEKLHETLQHTTDGRRLRGCVREMIRHGAQRILQKMEGADLPFEPWMNEVLVNCCHVEIRIEEAEDKLLHIRRDALKPVKRDVEAMLARSKQERFELLCQRTWQGRHGCTTGVGGGLGPEASGSMGSSWKGSMPDGNSTTAVLTTLVHMEDHSAKDGSFRARAPQLRRVSADSSFDGEGGLGSTSRCGTAPPASAGTTGDVRTSEQVLQEMRAAEANIQSLRRLLNDMRHNAAAVVCNQIRQAEKSGGREAGKQAAEWGNQMLSMLVSEEFAKATMKELQKSAPTAKLTQ